MNYPFKVRMNTANSTSTTRSIPLRFPQGQLSKHLARVFQLQHTEHLKISAGDTLKLRPPLRGRLECDIACDATIQCYALNMLSVMGPYGLQLTLKLKMINCFPKFRQCTFWLNILHNTLSEDACRNTVNVISYIGVQCLLTDCCRPYCHKG